jgi:rubredoxin
MTVFSERKEMCPVCGALLPTFDEIYGFYKCAACGQVWGYPEDDPDYEEFDDLVEDIDLAKSK